MRWQGVGWKGLLWRGPEGEHTSFEIGGLFIKFGRAAQCPRVIDIVVSCPLLTVQMPRRPNV